MSESDICMAQFRTSFEALSPNVSGEQKQAEEANIDQWFSLQSLKVRSADVRLD
ncbi:MAG: hypothetical protein RMX68_013680 [Aulosira sp. ZfuVER01]|nr:hypothetical protein [Aulosira sp. ZfuVER01]MDZ8001171.1 hypothetical protein [Aulosira sp. DedVER01a]MDZ8053125.1 hypothetical protein [Aulosira sp. ZfuCHP01]